MNNNIKRTNVSNDKEASNKKDISRALVIAFPFLFVRCFTFLFPSLSFSS
jgi:hypothetical protein